MPDTGVNSLWLVQVGVINFESGEEVRLLAERTGGDAARLHAPVEPHGLEEDLLHDCSSDCDAAACLDFACDLILVSWASTSLVTCCEHSARTVRRCRLLHVQAHGR